MGEKLLKELPASRSPSFSGSASLWRAPTVKFDRGVDAGRLGGGVCNAEGQNEGHSGRESLSNCKVGVSKDWKGRGASLSKPASAVPPPPPLPASLSACLSSRTSHPAPFAVVATASSGPPGPLLSPSPHLRQSRSGEVHLGGQRGRECHGKLPGPTKETGS